MSESTNKKEKRILIVDDTPNNIRVLVPIFLEQGGFQINVANNGRHALEMVEKVMPDLILLDIMMPELDGYETCKILKESEQTKNIPVIFLTAKTETEDIAKGFGLGAADFVTKPFNSVELLARVRTHLELKESRDYLQKTLEDLVAERTRELERETQEKLKIEAQLQQSKKLEAIGQLAGGVAHDFNNQLAGIIGAAELLSFQSKDEKQQKYIDMILKAAKSSADLTKQLLAFARKGKERSIAVDINNVIIDITKLLERSIDKRVEIKHNFSEEHIFAKGDPTQLENAILNIAINAGHAMPEGGVLTFSTELIELDKHSCAHLPFDITPGPHVEINVEDSGTGMSKETCDKIFEPFFTTKPKSQGTGMGLAAVYGTIKNHNGAIKVYSEIGSGTKFTLYLPHCDEKGEHSSGDNDVVVSSSQSHILLVDDEDVVIETASDMLRELGYHVSICRNGKEAVEFYEKESDKVDLVILDKIMPIMGGLETFIKMKEIRSDVKVILASGYSDEQAQDILDEGVQGFVQKPYSLATISQAIAKALHS